MLLYKDVEITSGTKITINVTDIPDIPEIQSRNYALTNYSIMNYTNPSTVDDKYLVPFRFSEYSWEYTSLYLHPTINSKEYWEQLAEVDENIYLERESTIVQTRHSYNGNYTIKTNWKTGRLEYFYYTKGTEGEYTSEIKIKPITSGSVPGFTIEIIVLLIPIFVIIVRRREKE